MFPNGHGWTGSGESGFLTLEQLYALRDQHGWEIAGHAHTVAAHNEPNGLDSIEGKALQECVTHTLGIASISLTLMLAIQPTPGASRRRFTSVG